MFLQQCIECNGGPLSSCAPTGVGSGAGVTDADIIVYVSAVDYSMCVPTGGACYIEGSLDR